MLHLGSVVEEQHVGVGTLGYQYSLLHSVPDSDL